MEIRFPSRWLGYPVRSIRFNRVCRWKRGRMAALITSERGPYVNGEHEILPFIVPFKNSYFPVPKLFITRTEGQFGILYFQKGKEKPFKFLLK